MTRVLCCLLLLCHTCLQSVSQQLYELLRRAPCSGLWMERLEQQQDHLRFMEHAMDVVMFCSADQHVGAAAHSMADIGRRLLSGNATGDSDTLALHVYLELQTDVKAFCCMNPPMTDALESMEAAVTSAVPANSG